MVQPDQDHAPPRRPGRRKDVGKRESILDAARRLMFAHGVESVSMEQVAAAAGVSKVTVYGHFGDKLSLFEAVVRQQAEWLTAGLPEEGPLADRLIAFGQRLLGFLMAPERLAADRLLRQQAMRHPELGRRFFNAGPGRLRDDLAAVLATAVRAHHIDADDPALAAEDLISLWKGFLELESHYQGRPAPGAEELRRRAARGVEVFLRAYEPKRFASALAKKPFGSTGGCV